MPFRQLCTQPLPAGMLAGKCDACADVDDLIEGVSAIRAAFGSDVDAVVRTIRPTRYEALFPAED